MVSTRKDITNFGGGGILDTINKGTPNKLTPNMGDFVTPPSPEKPHINNYLGEVEIKVGYGPDNGITPVNGKSGSGSDSETGNDIPPKPTLENYPEYETGPTGSGIKAALGTQYSWDKKGTDQATLQYQQDALAAKQEALANRQTIEQNSLQYQQQADMMKYANNQEAEKVGWTGGYVLDQKRQMEYLKASIQAQMYGAMELQKYGYDSALAAARLSYDLNQQQFAHQYYMDAVTIAMQEATQSGQYISAEIKDMLSQYGTATEILNSKDATEADKERATQIQTTINSWFESNGLSKTGVQTLAAYESARSLWLQERELEWNQYMDMATLKQAGIKALNEQLSTNLYLFEELDAEGNRIFNEETGEYKTLDFSKMTPDQILKYVGDNEHRLMQIYGQIDYNIENIVTKILNQNAIKDDKGNITYKSNTVNELLAALKKNSTFSDLKDILKGYTYSEQRDNYTYDISIDKEGNLKVSVRDFKSGQGPAIDTESNVIVQDNNVFIDGTQVETKEDVKIKNTEIKYSANGTEYIIITYEDGTTESKETGKIYSGFMPSSTQDYFNNSSLITAETFTLKTSQNNYILNQAFKFNEQTIKITTDSVDNDAELSDDDCSIIIGNKNYNVDITWDGEDGLLALGTDEGAVRVLETLSQCHPSEEPTVAIVNGRVALYQNGRWGVVKQGFTNGDNESLESDIKKYYNGTTVWGTKNKLNNSMFSYYPPEKSSQGGVGGAPVGGSNVMPGNQLPSNVLNNNGYTGGGAGGAGGIDALAYTYDSPLGGLLGRYK